MSQVNQENQQAQPTKEEQLVKRLQEQEQKINALKVRLFDSEEQAHGVTDTMNQFVGRLAQLFGIEGEHAQNLNNYISVAEQVVELANKQIAAQQAVVPESADGVVEGVFQEVAE